jgi:hypothetical protein
MTICGCQKVTEQNKPCAHRAVAVALYLNQRQPVCAYHKRYLAGELTAKRIPYMMTALPKEDKLCQTLTK